MELIERVREQYNSAPYPGYSWLAQCPLTSFVHCTFEAGSALIQKKWVSHEDKKIALLGCGTFEPYAFGKWHPATRVQAVDLSENSLKLARRRCLIRNVHNVHFHNENLIEFCEKNQNSFDYIHSYGALHHLEDPQKGFNALSQSLKLGGFARIMVYSRGSRNRTRDIQKVIKQFSLQSPSEITAFVRGLPWSHPLKLGFYLNSDNLNSTGIVDSLFHACEHDFSIQELKDTLKKAGLFIHAWDLSSSLHSLLDNASTTTEKIEELEAYDQWPAPFTFWVSRNSPRKESGSQVKALLKPPPFWKSSVPSTLLRKNVSLTRKHMDVWRRCWVAPQPIASIENDGKKPLDDLLRARFLIAVNP